VPAKTLQDFYDEPWELEYVYKAIDDYLGRYLTIRRLNPHNNQMILSIEFNNLFNWLHTSRSERTFEELEEYTQNLDKLLVLAEKGYKKAGWICWYYKTGNTEKDRFVFLVPEINI
jgi:hypothetical protein